MRHLMVRASVGNTDVMIGVEVDTDGYSPDLIDDVANRVTRMVRDLTGVEPEEDGSAAILAGLRGDHGWR